MTGRHGSVVRGLTSVGKSPQFEGRFGRIFRRLPQAHFGRSEAENIESLSLLGRTMSAAFDAPKDGKDDEESGIPALYTYLGQFIDHDLTFDPASSLQKANDPDSLVDYRTPRFDLDNVYGRGPDDQPYLYDDSGRKFNLGTPITGAGNNVFDLPRSQPANGQAQRAIIGDPRNDENAIVSQLQGLFLQFHNRLADENPGLPFEEVQREVRYHYQYVVVNDFLPRIVHKSVLDTLKTNGAWDREKLRIYQPRRESFIPVEFSVAAYRLGHSMVRPGYRLNDSKALLLPIFPVPSKGLPEGLTGFRKLIPEWALDWARFIDLELREYDGNDAAKARRLQFAYKIDTSLVNPLAELPPSVAVDPSSLAARNLLRGWRLGLPSGQTVARALGAPVLRDEEILVRKLEGAPSERQSIAKLGPAFQRNTPLWTYILAEAEQNKTSVELPVKGKVSVETPQLGPVGGRIVAEVFLGLLFHDSTSFLSQYAAWTPSTGANYKLKDFVAYALGAK